MSATPITVRDFIKEILDSGVSLDALVYVQRDKDAHDLRGVWFAGHRKKLGEGTVIVIREIEP